MIKSLHIGCFLARPEESRVLADFLQAIGFERLPGGNNTSGVFSAPSGTISITQRAGKHPRQVRKRLKDAAEMIALEVSNPDDIFSIAQTMRLKVLADVPSSTGGERTFWVELPGGIVMAIHGKPEELPAGIEGKLDAHGKRFAIVVSRFNAFITERLLQGAVDGLKRCGAGPTKTEIVRVPGSFEIPSAARALASTRKYDAIICLGCLLRGETAHYDVIVNEVTRGIGQSAQETGIPHALGVLTCDTLEQAIDRAGLKMGNKGFEAALAAVEMANLRADLGRRASDRSKASLRKRARKSTMSHRARPTQAQ